eukprot:4417388-Pyramimonas_sp.AAC.1
MPIPMPRTYPGARFDQPRLRVAGSGIGTCSSSDPPRPLVVVCSETWTPHEGPDPTNKERMSYPGHGEPQS